MDSLPEDCSRFWPLWARAVLLSFSVPERALRRQQTGGAGPPEFRSEHLDRLLRGVGVGHHAVLEQVVACLLDLDVAGQRCHDRLVDSLVPELLDDLADEFGEDHRWGDDGVPIAEDQRVYAWILET